MFTHAITVAVTAAAVTVAGIACAGTASALRSGDDSFLADIGHAGISYDAPSAAIANAHYVCASLDGGVTLPVLGAEILGNTDLTQHQAAAFVVSAVDAYCPQHAHLFQ
jgi:hypothetical protein